jgi:hypothetical protein
MILRTILAGLGAATVLAASPVFSPAKADHVAWWTPRLVICDANNCREAPDPYWEGPARVQRPCRDWQQCYWRQRWW